MCVLCRLYVLRIIRRICLSVCLIRTTFQSLIFLYPVVPSFNNRHYVILSGATSYNDAFAKASASTFRGMKGYLASIDTFDEYTFIRSALRVRGAWVSLTDTSSEGTWMTGNTALSNPRQSSVLPWYHNEPNGGTTENCVMLSLGGLFDYPCGSSSFPHFVVEYECVSPMIYFRGGCIGMSR